MALGCLGEPSASVWFVAEIPSLTQMERAIDPTPEDQWNISPGDALFREQLVAHGFKFGSADSPGGWHCYITDVVKSVDQAKHWNKLPESTRKQIAEAWAPVLRWELELGQPTVVVSVGRNADHLLDHLLRRRLIPSLPRRMKVDHYSYIGSRPDAQSGLGPRHPARIAAWSEQFADVRTALHGSAEPPTTPPVLLSDRSETRPAAQAPQSSRTTVPIEVPEFVRGGIEAGLTPGQIWARSGKRHAIYLAAITEEARVAGELGTLAPTGENVQTLRDQLELRWERIAVRVFGDPRRTREAMNLYDEAKARAGAAQESYTGKGRRFPRMRPS